jgi:3-(3-hydroxy-phenyl)propionate hydroxylase
VRTARGRLRDLARTGFPLITDRDDLTVDGRFSTPVRVLATTSEVTTALEAYPGETWVVRPDAYLAAVVPAGTDVNPALRRACGHSQPRTIVGSK